MIPVSTLTFFDIADSMMLSPTPHDAPFNRKFNMAVVKPEIIITKAVYQLEGKFQRLTQFSVSASSMAYSPMQHMLDTHRRRPIPEMQDS